MKLQGKKSVSTLVRLLPAVSAILIALGTSTIQASTKVGTAAAVNTAAFGAAPGQVRQAKVIGDNVVYNERIETSGTGLVQVLLNDGSTFTVGANSDLVIDEFVYDPNSGTGKLVASFSKGVARFVGGKLSKNKGGVTVKTPVGTIGIRGGIANLNLFGEDPSFSLLFGEELTFNGNDGTNRRIYQSGYTLQIGDAGGRIRPTNQSDLDSVQSGLSSNQGQSGGTGNPPTNQQVASSGLPGVNSDLSQVQTAPPPKPQAVQSTELINTENQLVQINKTTQQQTRNDLENQSSEETVQVRILTAGSTFVPVWDSSRTVTSPGAQGLLGGNYGVNQNIGFKFGNVTSGDAIALGIGTVEGNDVYQFRFSGSGDYFYSQTYSDAGTVQQHGNSEYIRPVPTIEGNVASYAWGAQYYNENFLAFAHLPNVIPGGSPAFNIETMIVGLWGLGTDFNNFGTNDGVLKTRRYSLSSDPTTMFTMGSNGADGSFYPAPSDALFVNPLVAKELGATFMNNIQNSDLRMIQEQSNTLDGSHYLASSFHIQGAGAAQKSLVSLSSGTVYFPGANMYGVMSSARRGSHRIASSQTAGLYSGPIGSVAGPDGGHFFGNNAQSFVLGNSMINSALNDPYNDSYVDRPAAFQRENTVSATLHVGELTEGSETNVSSLARTTRTLNGYAAGVLESTVNYYDYEVDGVAFASNGPSDVTVGFNAGENSVGGSIKVRDSDNRDPEVDSYTVRFGFNSDNSGHHRGTFIDNDVYAARDASNKSQTFLETDSPSSTLPQDPSNSPNTYFIPNTLVPSADNAIMSGVTECTCAFLEWGYWGTSMQYDDTGGALTSTEERYDNFHLGTWVAGDVTNAGSLPASGSATYAGHAVGNVINGSAQYLAAGNFNMTVNFGGGSGTGTASVTGFDGRNFSANLAEQAVGSGNLFSGALASGGTGTINTSLVGGPTDNYQGAIGNFNAVDGTWRATGVLAGERTGTGP